MRKYISWLVTFSILLSLFAMTAMPVNAAESVNIKVTLDEGIDGKVKRGKGFPLVIHLENNDEAFSGDVLIRYNPSYNSGGVVALRVELPEGSTKSYQVSLPGMVEDPSSYGPNATSITLYKGSWKNGTEVNFKGDKTIKPRLIEANTTFIGVLSENYDRLKELRTLPSLNSQMVPLTEKEIPKQGLGLEMIDYLVVDEFALSSLDEQQQQAIKEWISLGGVLVAGASPDAAGSYGQLYTMLPMKPETESKGTTQFLDISKTEKPPFEELPLFTGAVEKGAEILQKSGQLPVVVKKEYGSGAILQTSFSLGDQPLSNWLGYSTWFKNFLTQGGTGHTFSQQFGQDFYDRLYWEFVEANEYFPSSNYTITQLMLIILVYIVIIVPVLYFFLRKIDKREHSWWIIPSLAVLMTIIVFGLGAKDRIAEPQLNQMGVYQLNNKQLMGIQATTLLSNTSGNYTIELPKGQFNAIPHNRDSYNFDPTNSGVTVEQRKNTEMVFRNVGYWSSKTLYGRAQKDTEGEFVTDLQITNNQLTGTIENRFPYDFEEIFIWSGNQKIEVGSLKKGETKKIDQKIKQTFLTGPAMLSNQGMYMNQQTDIEKMKMERIQYAAYLFLNGNVVSGSKPLIGGMTKDEVVKVNISGKKEKKNNLNLVLAPFEAKSDFRGEFTITNEMLSTDMEVVTGMIHEKGINGSPNEMTMEDGEYDYKIRLPEPMQSKKVKIKSINIRINTPQMVQYSLLNRVTGEYLVLKPDQRNVTLVEKDQVEQYFSDTGELIIKVHKNTQGDPFVYLPQITVKGEVTP
jgi:hypothetical protein